MLLNYLKKKSFLLLYEMPFYKWKCTTSVVTDTATEAVALFSAVMLMLAFVSAPTEAGTVSGPANETIVNPGSAAASWEVLDGAKLTVNSGAETLGINVIGGSKVIMNGASAISGTGFGLSLKGERPAFGGPSSGAVTNSIIQGTSFGIRLATSVLDLTNSTVKGVAANSTGMNVWNGTLTAIDSTIVGEGNGLFIRSDVGPGGTEVGHHSTVVLDNTIIDGKSGSAIVIDGQKLDPTSATITVSNGSVLKAGNGKLLDVRQGGYADFTADNSILEGNMIADSTSSAEITLRNNASLNGILTDIGGLRLASGGTWKLTGDSTVAKLTMNDGVVEVSDGTGAEFHVLTIGTLSGNGTFVIGTNLSVPAGDKIIVNDAGGASGEYTLQVKNTGVEPTVGTPLTVVQTNGGDADFFLLGDVVDLGVYKYFLRKVGDDWQLKPEKDETGGLPCIPDINCPVEPPVDPEPRSLSESAKTVISLHAAASNIWYAETGILRQRLGDVRTGRGENGLWGRSYGRAFKGNTSAGVDFDQNIGGGQAGAEREVNLGGVPVILGAFGGYSDSKIKLEGSSDGKTDSGYGGLYAVWLGKDGLYVDSLLKFNRFSNHARVVMADGTGASGDYSATGVGGQIEVGKTFDLGNNWFTTPFGQLSALRISSFSYSLNNGLNTDSDAYGSLQGRVGVTFGYNNKLENGGAFQPYSRLALAQEFIDSNKLKINGIDFNNAFNGTRGEVGAGFAYELNNALQIYADVDFSGGAGVTRNWGGNFGLSFKF